MTVQGPSSVLEMLQLLHHELPICSPPTFSTIFRFIMLASGLKDDILLVQAASHHPDSAPLALSPAIKLFLAGSCDISESDVDTYWKALRNTIWHGDGGASSTADMDDIWLTAPRPLFPPHHTCQTRDCPAHVQGTILKKAQRQVVLYTLDNGPIATYSVHLYCAKCNTNYHHSFSVKAGVRTFYPGIPDILQVGGHQFVETKVVHLWRTMMLVSWTSMSNCARLYNSALMQNATSSPGFSWNFELAGDHVWHGFVQLALIED
ncbi:hypothetical protein BDR03DRAFT_881284, partial [Suillus americanus]